MDLTPKQQTSEAIRQAETIIVTTGQHPSVDQVSAVIALTAILRKFGKQVTAAVTDSLPQSVQLLETNVIDRNLSGMRDFILKLDVSKAELDKLRYEVIDGKLQIFITPFKGGFAPSDVTFDYGSFKYDLAIVLGVPTRARVDRIFEQNAHTFNSIPVVNLDFHRSNENYGAVNLIEPNASSLCEMLVALAESLQSGIIDAEIATALLMGIMGSTDRFTASHTTSKSLTVAAQMMAAGARQQAVVKALYRGGERSGERGDRQGGERGEQRDRGERQGGEQRGDRGERQGGEQRDRNHRGDRQGGERQGGERQPQAQRQDGRAQADIRAERQDGRAERQQAEARPERPEMRPERQADARPERQPQPELRPERQPQPELRPERQSQPDARPERQPQEIRVPRTPEQTGTPSNEPLVKDTAVSDVQLAPATEAGADSSHARTTEPSARPEAGAALPSEDARNDTDRAGYGSSQLPIIDPGHIELMREASGETAQEQALYGSSHADEQHNDSLPMPPVADFSSATEILAQRQNDEADQEPQA